MTNTQIYKATTLVYQSSSRDLTLCIVNVFAICNSIYSYRWMKTNDRFQWWQTDSDHHHYHQHDHDEVILTTFCYYTDSEWCSAVHCWLMILIIAHIQITMYVCWYMFIYYNTWYHSITRIHRLFFIVHLIVNIDTHTDL